MRRWVWVLILVLALVGSAQAKSIEIWTWYDGVMGGIFRDLIQSQFTPATGIEVVVNSIPISDTHFNRVLMAHISGDMPDIIELYPSSAMELGMRGILTNLREFPNSAAILSRMGPSLHEAVSFRNNTFAVFGEYNWFLTYYRRDIFDDIGVEAPISWNDFLSINAKLRARGMSSFWDAGVVHKLMALAHQWGGDLYSADGMASGLDTPEAIGAFQFLTSLHTEHHMDLVNPIFTTFLSGQTPLAILQTWQYSIIERIGPQIEGKWDIAQKPGTPRAGGGLDHSTAGTGLIWGIPKASPNKQEAWEFIQWLTSDEFLQAYSTRVLDSPERMRLIFANQSILDTAIFPEEQIPVLRAGLTNSVSQRAVVGGFIADRYIDFAFNKVVIGGEDPVKSILQAARESTSEMQRKQREFARFIDRID